MLDITPNYISLPHQTQHHGAQHKIIFGVQTKFTR